MLGIKDKVPRWSPKIKILTEALENWKKCALKHFTENPFYLISRICPQY